MSQYFDQERRSGATDKTDALSEKPERNGADVSSFQTQGVNATSISPLSAYDQEHGGFELRSQARTALNPTSTNGLGHGTGMLGVPTATMVDFERMCDHDGFVDSLNMPRNTTIVEESSFDWNGDVDIDEKGEHRQRDKPKSPWKQIPLCIRMVLLMLFFGFTLAIPAILTEHYMTIEEKWHPDPEVEYRNELRRARKDTIILFFVWMSFMACIICLTNWGIDIVPAVVVQFGSWFTSSKLESVKSRMLIFVATKKYIKWVISTCWALGSFAFLCIFVYPRVRNQSWYPTVLNVLGAIVAGAALIFVEKVLLQIISKNFHQTAYADRITENKYALSVLDQLGTSRKNVKRMRGNAGNGTRVAHTSDCADHVSTSATDIHSTAPSRSNSWDNVVTAKNTSPCSISQQTLAEHSEMNTSHRGIVDSRLSPGDSLKDAKSRRGSTQSMTTSYLKELRDRNDIIKGLNKRLRVMRNVEGMPSKDINSTENAKRLARTLFYNLQGNGDQLVVQDFYPYFDTEEEAQKAFNLFDKDGNGDISKQEMKEKIFYVYKERKDLYTSLRDLSQAVGKLDIIFLTIVAVVWLLIILSIFGTSVVQNMLSIGSFLVALSFVFGNSLRTLFENIVFLFITHPYDSGDLCDIDGTFMFVREVGLNSTMFVTWDGRRMYYPNNILSQKPIHNVRRSPNMSERIVVHVDVYTPQAKILELRSRMREFLAKEPKEFGPDMEIQIQEIDIKLKISMVIEHKGNWQDTGRRWARRTKFHYALRDAIDDLGIKYYGLPKRIELLNCDKAAAESLAFESSVRLPSASTQSAMPMRSTAPGLAENHQDANEDTFTSFSTSQYHMPSDMERLCRRNVDRRPEDDIGPRNS
ncbi:hypothetical protein BGZ94_007395 [Podila epigama]|nr:hypothetical protein BGZ94_007395 [Podila epigama]